MPMPTVSSVPAKLPKREALAQLPAVFDADRMMRDIEFLSSEELQGRGFGTKGLEKAGAYIKSEFEKEKRYIYKRANKYLRYCVIIYS